MVETAERREKLHPPLRHGSLFSEAARVTGQFGKSRLRVGQIAGQEFAFGAVQLQSEPQLTASLPRVLCQHVRARAQIAERRGVSGRGLGTRAGKQVELGQLFPFLW